MYIVPIIPKSIIKIFIITLESDKMKKLEMEQATKIIEIEITLAYTGIPLPSR